MNCDSLFIAGIAAAAFLPGFAVTMLFLWIDRKRNV